MRPSPSTQSVWVRRAIAALACVFAAVSPGAAQSKGVRRPPNLPTTSNTSIASPGPLTSIFLGDELSAQIAHSGDTDYEVYPPDTIPGDYGTFLFLGGVLYSPDFADHGGTATDSIGTYTAYTPVSQSGVTGSGTSGDPYAVTTVASVGTTGLSVTQTDSYVVGDEFYRTDMVFTNSTNAPISAVLYRAMDCYLGGSDSGYGVVSGGAVGCAVNANNSPPARIEELVPITSGNAYYEAFYDDVWAAIGAHTAFNNTCQCDNQIDNAAGVSWNINVPANGSLTVSHYTVFSPTGNLAITTTKAADQPQSAPGATNGYTITFTNPNSTAVPLTSITDTLPAGFTYVGGSSSGATTADPSVNGQQLTWNGSFSVPANGPLTLHFQVTVSSATGTYTNQAGGVATGYAVAPTGPTAPIVVGTASAITTTKTANQAQSTAGATNGYTVTFSNPNSTAVTLTAITDTLPAGFTYVTGSSSGATTADPSVSGQQLTWNGSFNVPASGTLQLRFQVHVSTTTGTYTNQAGGVATGYTVTPTGATAPIEVVAAAEAIPALGTAGLFGLALVLGVVGVFAIMRLRS
jgi:uncharacterized repeat protein (TIGR01451 family)